MERVERAAILSSGDAACARAGRDGTPGLVESQKVVVAEIPKSERPPTVIRVSVFRQGGHDYADVRIYRLGRSGAYPTRVGLPIHRDLLPNVLAGLRQAADALVAHGPG